MSKKYKERQEICKINLWQIEHGNSLSTIFLNLIYIMVILYHFSLTYLTTGYLALNV